MICINYIFQAIYGPETLFYNVLCLISDSLFDYYTHIIYLYSGKSMELDLFILLERNYYSCSGNRQNFYHTGIIATMFMPLLYNPYGYILNWRGLLLFICVMGYCRCLRTDVK